MKNFNQSIKARGFDVAFNVILDKGIDLQCLQDSSFNKLVPQKFDQDQVFQRYS